MNEPTKTNTSRRPRTFTTRPTTTCRYCGARNCYMSHAPQVGNPDHAEWNR